MDIIVKQKRLCRAAVEVKFNVSKLSPVTRCSMKQGKVDLAANHFGIQTSHMRVPVPIFLLIQQPSLEIGVPWVVIGVKVTAPNIDKLSSSISLVFSSRAEEPLTCYPSVILKLNVIYQGIVPFIIEEVGTLNKDLPLRLFETIWPNPGDLQRPALVRTIVLIIASINRSPDE